MQVVGEVVQIPQEAQGELVEVSLVAKMVPLCLLLVLT